MPRVPRFVLFGLLFSTLLGEGAILYFVEDRTVRLYAGLALFLAIAWLFATPAIADVIADLPDQLRRRRYPKLRAQVTLLLAEVRRLHWTAVDRNRGIRSHADADADMDASEERMKGLLNAIRREAGVVSDEPDSGQVPDEPEADVVSDEPDQGPTSDEPSESEE